MTQRVATALALLLLLPTSGISQDDEEDLRPGLIATLTAGDRTVERVEPRIALRLRASQSLAPQLPPGPFQAAWRGLLQSQAPGDYRLHAYLNGSVQVKLRGQSVIDQTTSEAKWVVSAPIRDLPFDWHALEVMFQGRSDGAELRLFWSGPGFGVEPISARLFHERGRPANPTSGRVWTDALRCAACHRQGSLETPEPAPSLTRIKNQLKPEWIIQWLTATAESTDSARAHAPLRRRMPYYGFAKRDALAIAAFLWSQSTEPNLRKAEAAPKEKNKKEKPEAPSVDHGQRLVLTVGCLACHTYEETGEDNLYGGSDLTHIADKRPLGFFKPWLRDPGKLNPHHRMPHFELNSNERNHIAVFLASRTAGDRSIEGLNEKLQRAANDPGVVQRGRELATAHGCAACHEIKGLEAKPVPLTDLQLKRDGCAGDDVKGHPAYGLGDAPRGALLTYFRSAAATKHRSPNPDGDLSMQRRNCASCHQRENRAGLARRLTRTIAEYPELAAQTPAMTPPSLLSVGDKLQDQALRSSIEKPDNSHRPWLLVRMPKYRMADGEVAAITDHLIVADRIPAGAHSPDVPASDESHGLVGARLVTPDGFGCTSCHQVGGVKPPKAPLNAKGPSLSSLGKRIRYAWFDRWVRNPARIVPRMEMPSVQIPVAGVLNNDLDRQLQTVWNVLNDPSFRPPAPNPVRTVRATGDPTAGELAHVLTDVLQQGDSQYIKPLLIGLPNRHNILYDLEHARLTGWWIGDAARQRTKGKTWFWEPGAEDMLGGAVGDVLLHVGGRTIQAERRGQFVTELDQWRHEKGALRFAHRLRFATADGARTIHVRQFIRPRWPTPNQLGGWRRSIQVEGLPDDGELSLPLLAEDVIASAQREGDSLRWTTGPGGTKLVSSTRNIAPSGRVRITASQPDVTFTYSASAAPDRFPAAAKLPNLEQPVVLDSTPGFESVRLPLIGDVMPTGLAWRPDGGLVFASLKGRVWLASDTDGDGLEDSLRPFSDELAAPFGVHAEKDYIDVVNKYSLLRLYDKDGDGRSERAVTLASGWGHTADYHDWAIGLPRDKNGNYWIATACQQDKRSKAAAALRGVVMKLKPRRTSDESPHLYEIETVTTGHRFPIGIARNRHGRTFVADNQGNYNPFNELNHIVAGKSYGFINAIDRNSSFKAPPITAPAVKIPHPWTRSVNGICFLETPERLRGDGPIFGPFEGHLIGAEYDTRRLVRISLQEVDGWMQGAAYPFSDYHPRGGATFLGPITCAVSPRGELYVGCIRDSGWGGANNIGTIVRMRPQLDRMPTGIAEVLAAPDGFVVRFTKPVDPKRAGDAVSYSVSSYTRQPTPAYGGPDLQRRKEKVSSVRLADDRMSVRLKFAEMRTGFVYEIRIRSLAADGGEFFPAEAFYSLTRTPANAP